MHTASLCHWIMEYMHSNNGAHNAYSFTMPLDNGDCTVIMEYIMHTASPAMPLDNGDCTVIMEYIMHTAWLCHWIMETAQ